mgnify:CR=1 FL=1
MQKIYFRADAGAEIGYGHFIRTLALADMLKDDFSCVFVTQAPTIYQKSEVAKVCELVEVPATEEKFRLFLDMLNGDEIVVLDNYFYDTDYQQKIRAKGCRLVCIDDMHNKHYVADVVINHTLTDSGLFDVEPYTKLCLGFDWALLRRPFIEAVNKLCSCAKRTESITITFGGVDSFDFTGHYIREAMQLPTVSQITAVVGDAYQPQKPRVRDRRVSYCSNLTAQQMAELFCASDWVICSASTVSIEAIACGAKLAVGWYVDNQADYYSLLTSTGGVLPLGNIKDNPIPLTSLEIAGVDNLQIKSGIRERYINLFEELGRNVH